MISVTVFLAPGFEEVEAITPVDYLRRAGADVTLVAVPVNGKCSLQVEGAHGICITADTTLEAYSSMMSGTLSDAVFVPGGMPGAANIGACSDVLAVIKAAFKADKLTAAICAAPVVVFAKTGILAGKHWTCYPGMEKQLEKYCGPKVSELTAGSVHSNSSPFVTDGNLVTGRGPGCAEQFAMELVRILCGTETALRVKTEAVQR